MSKYTEVQKSVEEKVLAYARGVYQESLLRGDEAWSGATLKGKAAKYGSHYKKSRENLLKRLSSSFLVKKEIRKHGKIVYIIQEKVQAA